jgi:hypothetical protein
VREIAAATGTDPGYVSRLVALLEREAFVERDRRGRVQRTDWQRLIPRWAEAAPLDKRGNRTSCLAPRGLPAAMERLEETSASYAITGSFAAVRIAPVAGPRLLVLYVQDPEAICRSLDLRPADSGANVMLIAPRDESLLHESETDDTGLRYAPLVQLAADLSTGPGRNPAEAEALLKWMAANEEAWRG